jgi:hypothetical protein
MPASNWNTLATDLKERMTTVLEAKGPQRTAPLEEKKIPKTATAGDKC